MTVYSFAKLRKSLSLVTLASLAVLPLFALPAYACTGRAQNSSQQAVTGPKHARRHYSRASSANHS